jgi:PAS domain S-box-containing protein
MTDAHGFGVYFNQRCYEYSGLAPGELLGGGWKKLIHPEDMERTLSSWQTAVCGEDSYDVEYRLRRWDGEYHWFIARAKPIKDTAGKTTGWFGTSTDISERKQVEADLRSSQERLSLALTIGKSGAYEWDIKRNVNRWSPELEVLYGLEPGSFGGTYEAWRDCLLPEDVEQAEQRTLPSLTTGHFDAEWRIRRKNDGEVRWISAQGRVFFDAQGKPERMIGLNADITERKQSEERMKLSESRYRSLVEASAQLVWSCPGSGYLDHPIPEWQQFTGQTTEQVLGWGWAEAVHPEDHAETLRVWQQAVATQSVYTVEYRLRRKDGVYRHMLGRGVPVLGASGEVIEYLGMHNDVTEQKLAEEALIKAEKLAAAGRLAATVAHEINNPLEAATNLLYLLGTEINLSEEGRNYLSAAERELSRVAHVVRQTLGFYREQSAREPIELQSLLDEVLQLHQGRIVHKGIQVSQEIPPSFVLRTVPGELRQVISNLVSNSLDALPARGKLRIRARRVVVNGSSRMQITVADSGCGFSRDTALHLFEPFFTTKKSIGTGLGLWVSRQLIHKHQGTIRTRSREGSGTVFRIQFPADQGVVASAA